MSCWQLHLTATNIFAVTWYLGILFNKTIMNSHQLSLSTCIVIKFKEIIEKNVYFHGKIAKFFTVTIGQTAAHDVTKAKLL